MIRKRILFLLTTGLFVLSACGPQPDLSVDLTNNLVQESVWLTPSVNSAGWRIGFDQRLEPKDDVRQVASLTNWLARKTGLSFSVYISEQDGNVVDNLCAGKMDFAVAGTVSYLQANALCGAHILVRGRNLEGQDTYRSAIIVAPDSSIRSVQDLRGASFAFGAPNSTQGHLIPRLILQKAGLDLEDFSAYTYTGSHVATANAVTSGRYQAGALQDTLALDLARRGLVRILLMSDPYPSSGIVVGPYVPSQTAEIVQQALLQLDPTGVDAADLYQWSRTEMPLGFVQASDNEYDELRRIARLIGLLAP
jgi:phosphonate transport system substrate-binding protein